MEHRVKFRAFFTRALNWRNNPTIPTLGGQFFVTVSAALACVESLNGTASVKVLLFVFYSAIGNTGVINNRSH